MIVRLLWVLGGSFILFNDHSSAGSGWAKEVAGTRVQAGGQTLACTGSARRDTVGALPQGLGREGRAKGSADTPGWGGGHLDLSPRGGGVL